MSHSITYSVTTKRGPVAIEWSFKNEDDARLRHSLAVNARLRPVLTLELPKIIQPKYEYQPPEPETDLPDAPVKSPPKVKKIKVKMKKDKGPKKKYRKDAITKRECSIMDQHFRSI